MKKISSLSAMLLLTYGLMQPVYSQEISEKIGLFPNVKENIPLLAPLALVDAIRILGENDGEIIAGLDVFYLWEFKSYELEMVTASISPSSSGVPVNTPSFIMTPINLNCELRLEVKGALVTAWQMEGADCENFKTTEIFIRFLAKGYPRIEI